MSGVFNIHFKPPILANFYLYFYIRIFACQEYIQNASFPDILLALYTVESTPKSWHGPKIISYPQQPEMSFSLI